MGGIAESGGERIDAEGGAGQKDGIFYIRPLVFRQAQIPAVGSYNIRRIFRYSGNADLCEDGYVSALDLRVCGEKTGLFSRITLAGGHGMRYFGHSHDPPNWNPNSYGCCAIIDGNSYANPVALGHRDTGSDRDSLPSGKRQASGHIKRGVQRIGRLLGQPEIGWQPTNRAQFSGADYRNLGYAQ